MSKAGQKLWTRAALLVSNPTGLRFDRWLVALTGFSFINHFYGRAAGLEPKPCLLLTTRHHETGLPRTVVLPYQRDGKHLLIVGSHGGRPTDAIWTKNLRVHPGCEVRRHRRTRTSTAREAMGAERDHVWKIVNRDGGYLGYEKIAAPRVIPVFVIEEGT